MTGESHTIDGVTYALGYTYDSADRPLSLSYPAQSAETVNMAYTAQGQPGRMYSSVDYVQSGNVVYDVAGRLTQLKLGKQSGNSNPVVQMGFTYYPWTTVSGLGRLQQLTAGIPGNPSSLQNLTYAYDAAGNVDWIKDWKIGSPPNPQLQDFTVDRLNRLVNAAASGGTNGNYTTETYSYNNAGNLISKTGQGSYVYGVAQASTCPEGALVKKHAVVTAGSNAYCYDQNGNMRRRTIGGSVYNLTYDAENRLVSVSGAATASFSYDADGNRVKSVLNGETVIYVGNLYEKKVVGSTTTHTKYYYFGGRRIAVRVAGTLSWLLSDHLGSTAVTADGATGARTAELWYKPWGESRGTPFGVTPTARRFTGQREEAGIGLYFYNARYYDPSLGRFTQADTIVPQPGNPAALNRYLYTLGNPLKYTDSSGHFVIIPFLIAGAVGGVVGGGVDLVIQLTVDHKNIRDVNWAEVGGAAAGGLVAGATLGLAPAGASVLGLTLLGGIGSAAGGQASAITQATLEHYLGQGQQGSILQQARDLGFLDLESAAIDAGAGMATGLVGTGLGKLFRSTGLLSEAADTITRRGEVPMIRWEKTLDQPGRWTFRMEGRTIVTDADTLERLIRSAIQGGYEFAESVLLEAIQQGLVTVVEEQTGP